MYESVLKHKHAKLTKKNAHKQAESTSDTELESNSDNLVNVIKLAPQKQKKKSVSFSDLNKSKEEKPFLTKVQCMEEDKQVEEESSSCI